MNAEDADNGFAPSPGKVELLTLPTGPGVRVDTGIATGDAISPDYDSMVAKIIAWGRDRDEAMARLRVALRGTTVVVKGGTTTKSFLMELLDHPEVINGTADTGWLDRAGLTDQARVAPYADAALLYVGVDVYEAEEALERDAFLPVRPGRPAARRAHRRPGGRTRLPGADLQPERRADQSAPVPDRDRWRQRGCRGRDRPDEQVREPADDRRPASSRRRVDHARPGHLVEVDSVSHRVSRDEGGVVRSPAPAVVVAVRAAAGDRCRGRRNHHDPRDP